MSLARRDLEDSSRHVKTLEKQMKAVTQERDELHKVIGGCFDPRVEDQERVCVCVCETQR